MSPLSTEERAAVATAVLGLGSRAPAALRRLAPPGGERCASEASRLLALGREERIRTLLTWVRGLVGEEPLHLLGTHESWIDHALAAEDPAVRRAIESDQPPAVAAWLRRRLLGFVVTMGGMTELPGEAGRLASQTADELLRVFATVGRRRLALVAQAVPEAARSLAGRLGAHGSVFLSEVAATATRAQVRAAVAELADTPLSGDGATLLFRLGARHLAPFIVTSAGDLSRLIAQRIPRPMGLVLLEECARAGGEEAEARRGVLAAVLAELED